MLLARSGEESKQRNSPAKREGNKVQYTFNTTVVEHIDAVRKELGKLKPVEEHDKAIVKNTGELLKEGIKAIEVRQKHIKIAHRAKFPYTLKIQTSIILQLHCYFLSSTASRTIGRMAYTNDSQWPVGWITNVISC